MLDAYLAIAIMKDPLYRSLSKNEEWWGNVKYKMN